MRCILRHDLADLPAKAADFKLKTPEYKNKPLVLKRHLEHFARTGELHTVATYALIDLRLHELEEELAAADDKLCEEDANAISLEMSDVYSFKEAKDFGVTTMLALVEALQLGFQCQLGTMIIPPCLPETASLHIEQSWTNSGQAGPVLDHRVVEVDVVPESFLGRLLVAASEQGSTKEWTKHLRAWREGAVFHVVDEEEVFIASLCVQYPLGRDSDGGALVSIRTRAAKADGFGEFYYFYF